MVLVHSEIEFGILKGTRPFLNGDGTRLREAWSDTRLSTDEEGTDFGD